MVQQASSLRTLFAAFVAWKTLILLIVLLSPGIGYDTSSDLLLHTADDVNIAPDVPTNIGHILLKFVRWDAIYFTETARRGHAFEQEWAFGKGLSTVLYYTTKVIGIQPIERTTSYAVSGILISHLSHWFSVVLLFQIATLFYPGSEAGSSSLPLAAALLHVVSPAGAFLSAPYAESLFSFLNMLGFYLYIKSYEETSGEFTATRLFYKLFSGVSFGIATTIRSNGVLSGIPFFIDAIESTLQILSPNVDGFVKSRILLQLQFTVIAGSCIAAGLVWPQFLAYREYCVEGFGERSWCNSWLPSIFTFVQSYYWNVGFLRYWTVSNIPLFLLATPCLYLLIISGLQEVLPALKSNSSHVQQLRLRIALPQLILAVLALTNYHVQIITRLSSAYPMWYIWLAMRISDWSPSKLMVRVLIMYGLIQAGLFASFLPPA